MEALFVVARNTLDPFKQLMTEFVKNAGLDPDAIVMHKGKPLLNEDTQGPWRVLNVAPLKGETRCREKVQNEYGDDWSKLVDVVRCSIVVQTEDALESVAQAMSASSDPRYLLVRLKNRFKVPLFNGYRDALYSLAVCVEGVWHVCKGRVILCFTFVLNVLCSVYITRMEVRGYVTKSLFSLEEGFVIQESPVTCKKTCFATFQGETLHGRKNPLVVVRFFWVRFPSRPWYLKRYFSEFST